MKRIWMSATALAVVVCAGEAMGQAQDFSFLREVRADIPMSFALPAGFNTVSGTAAAYVASTSRIAPQDPEMIGKDWEANGEFGRTNANNLDSFTGTAKNLLSNSSLLSYIPLPTDAYRAGSGSATADLDWVSGSNDNLHAVWRLSKPQTAFVCAGTTQWEWWQSADQVASAQFQIEFNHNANTEFVISFGDGSDFSSEIKSAVQDTGVHPGCFNYVRVGNPAAENERVNFILLVQSKVAGASTWTEEACYIASYTTNGYVLAGDDTSVFTPNPNEPQTDNLSFDATVTVNLGTAAATSIIRGSLIVVDDDALNTSGDAARRLTQDDHDDIQNFIFSNDTFYDYNLETFTVGMSEFEVDTEDRELYQVLMNCDGIQTGLFGDVSDDGLVSCVDSELAYDARGGSDPYGFPIAAMAGDADYVYQLDYDLDGTIETNPDRTEFDNLDVFIDNDMDGLPDLCSCPDGDTNGDDNVNLADLQNILFNFGKTVPPAPTAHDLNGDGVVDLDDLQLVLFHFGCTPPA